MPDSQAVLGHRRSENRMNGGSKQGADGIGGNDPDDEACHHKKLGRKAHEEWRLVRRPRQVIRRGTEKNVSNKAKRIGHRKHASRRDDVGECAVDERVVVDFDRLGEEHLLGEKAVEQGNACHRRSGNHRQRRRNRHEPPQAAQATDVAGAAFVIDDPRGHEQGGLERRVIHDVEDGGHLPEGRIEADEQSDQPEVADGRVSQQPFEVLLKDGEKCAEDKGDKAR